MRNFDERFEKASHDFDRDFNRMKIWVFITGILGIIVSLGLIGFGIWVIIILLQFFGII